MSKHLWFKLDDWRKGENKNRRLITEAQAAELNGDKQKCGIFRTVNQFSGDTNLEENCTKLCSWYADLDDCTMPVREVIYAAKLFPSLVVKTKSGYHVYWHCENASFVNYTMLNKRLTRRFTPDYSVYDISRILRVPGYNHWKDADDPFMCHTVWEAPVAYSEEQMLWACSEHHPDEIVEQKAEQAQYKRLSDGDGFFVWLEQQNQMELLKELSGKACVRWEKYSFRSIGRGKYAILVNGEAVNCWIDAAGRIGSHARGGPLVYNWLRYFGMSPKEVVNILKQEFAK